jgi:hypothetical protein
MEISFQMKLLMKEPLYFGRADPLLIVQENQRCISWNPPDKEIKRKRYRAAY